MGILFAILAAIGWGTSAVFAGKGLSNIKVIPGTALSVLSSFFTVGVATVALQWNDLMTVSWQAIALFAAVGILSFALGRAFNYMGIERIGAARATSITACAPFFASLTAIIFLNERPNLLVIGGTILVIGGLYLTMSGGSRQKPESSIQNPEMRSVRS